MGMEFLLLTKRKEGSNQGYFCTIEKQQIPPMRLFKCIQLDLGLMKDSYKSSGARN
jgi:hypothetical protein